ncbi:hypothetical protein SAMN02745136_05138 [Anaerocolumna jejuensis DSM 15929]|uniref:DUF4366 domain-containing protein n=1 Tax=Anaerocolumna jejuensis DSM 15929 TaxID=1121322 RepID=A0A1M7BIV9_9FIRM|nr:hypothetical protein [Anaerocolumna jejuensis]SHL54806.1 hypothetical protein SAMN02745136_05138 [Anaerocolumna jejuensis DSM 15929]
MKKFGKILFGTVSIATLACGAYYLYKNILNKDSADDFDDFEDDFEDFDTEEDTPAADKKETREYVSINITSGEPESAEKEEVKDTVEE